MEKTFKEPEFAFFQQLLDLYPQAGVYLAGGAVRDVLLNRAPKDHDFIVTGVAPADLEVFLASRGRVDLTGRNFGVFKFKPEGFDLAEDIDIALPRRDRATGTGGYRDVEAQSDPNLPVEDDLARRDFTVNAMAQDARTGALIDPHGGRTDLGARLIRAVGEPRARFQEDYSRMLRGLRLAIQLGFEIESTTWQAIKSEIDHLNDQRDGEWVVPREVVAREFLKSLDADPVRTLDLWDVAGAFGVLMPELLRLKGCRQSPTHHAEGDVWVHTRLALTRLTSPEFRQIFGDEPPSVQLKLALLLHDIGKPDAWREVDGHITTHGHAEMGARIAAEIVRRLKLYVTGDGITLESIAWLVANHMTPHEVAASTVRPAELVRMFLNPGHPGSDLLKLVWADAFAAQQADGHFGYPGELAYVRRVEELRRVLNWSADGHPQPLLGGAAIMRILGIEPGPRISEVQDSLLDAQARGEIHDTQEAEAYVRDSLR